MEFEVGGTSITDSSSLASYPTMCALAARDKSTFSSFRKYEILVEALDHVSIQQGLEYLEEIVKLDGWTANSKKSLKKLIR